MLPSYKPGDILLATSWKKPRTGQVVIAGSEAPVLKRVIRSSTEGLWLEGDNSAASTDSRLYGWVTPMDIEACVIWPRR